MFKKVLNSLMNNRWRSLLWVSGIYLCLSFLFRLILIQQSWADIVVSPPQVLLSIILGILFDLAFLCFLAVPFSIFNWLIPDKLYYLKGMKLFRFLLMSSLIAGVFFLFASEWFFWEEFTARFNFISVDYLVYRREVTENIYQSYPVIQITSACIFLGLFFAGLIYKKSITKTPDQSQTHQSFRGRSVIALTVFALSLLIGFGVDQNARQFTKNRVLVEIASNGPYQFFAAFLNNSLDFDTFYATLPEKEAVDLFQKTSLVNLKNGFSPIHKVVSAGEEKHLNVVLVAIESLSARFMAYYGNKDSITPNLDKLISQSLLFDQAYATGSRTTRGLEAISLSIPPTPGRSLVKRLDQPARYNIGTEFRSRGYDTTFFYGGRSYFDNMQDFFTTNGFKVLDEQDYVSKDTGFSTAWGLADEYSYEQTLIEADKSYKAGKHFFSFIMTTSNHRPFTFPENRIDLPQGHREGVVKYTDWAIKDFLDKAKSKPWFDDTVFIFVADHCSSSAGRKNLTISKHHIPLLMYSPKHIKPGINSKIMSQIDIAPTLLGLLNFNYQSEFLGYDVVHNPRYTGRAFIANYQYLGLYKPGEFTYLKPKKEIIVDSDPLNSSTGTELSVGVDNQRAKDAIAIYQAADRIISAQMTANPIK